MPPYKKPDVKDILRKYGSKIEGRITSDSKNAGYSKPYIKFIKEERGPELTRYEKYHNKYLIKIDSY